MLREDDGICEIQVSFVAGIRYHLVQVRVFSCCGVCKVGFVDVGEEVVNHMELSGGMNSFNKMLDLYIFSKKLNLFLEKIKLKSVTLFQPTYSFQRQNNIIFFLL